MTGPLDSPAETLLDTSEAVVAVGMAPGHADVLAALAEPGAVAAVRLTADATQPAWWRPPPAPRRGRRRGIEPDAAEALAFFIGQDRLVWLVPDAAAAESAAMLPLPTMPLDLWSVATLLFPTIGRGERRRLGAALDIALPNAPPGEARAAAEEAGTVYQALVCHADTLDVRLLEEAVRLLGRTDTAEADFFQAALRRGLQRAFTADGDALDRHAPPEGEEAPSGQADPTELLGEIMAPPEPLRPAGWIEPVDADDVAAVLGPGGRLASALAEYEDRAGQREMAQAVADTLNRRDHLLVEAGTGTGKSLAYLVPAVLYAVANGRRVVVSTNTINLQMQLHEKDVPLLQQTLPQPFRAAVAKGRSNYLCLRRWRGFLRDATHSKDELFFATRILFWLRETQTGDRQELALSDEELGAWAQVSADVDSCTPQLCRYHRQGVCFLARARRQAEAAHVVIVNHALLLADIALENQVLPAYDDLIIDEAHHLEEEATDQLGLRLEQHALLGLLQRLSLKISQGRYGGLFGDIHSLLLVTGGPTLRERAAEFTQPAHDAVEKVVPLVRNLFDAVQSFAREVGEAARGNGDAIGQYVQRSGDRQLRLTAGNRRTEAWERVEEAWVALAEGLVVLGRAIARLHGTLADFRGASEELDEKLGDIQGAEREVGDTRANLEETIAAPQEGMIYWLEAGWRGVTLRSAPLDVGELLRQTLFATCDCVIMTSATLQVGGSFRYVLERLGLERDTSCLAVASPFDFRRQALLCVPGDLPPPFAPAYADALHAALQDICRSSGGQTLILFTSHAALRGAYMALRSALRDLTILAQGVDGPRTQLLERFRSTPRTVLLGTSSFWEGVDLLGEALTCLVIVKLPFTVPTDPIFAARSEELYGDKAFMGYAVPQAVLRLKQGFGRLIRSTTDRGVVVILDSRVLTKRYGRLFLKSLPPADMRKCRRSQLGRMVAKWLREPARLSQSSGG